MYRSPLAGAGFPSRGPFATVLIPALACFARADLTPKENPVSSVPVAITDGTALRTSVLAGDRSRSEHECTTGRFRTPAG